MADTFQTLMFQPGLGGLNLKDTEDLVPIGQLLRMTNVVGSKQVAGEIQSRPGQREIVTRGTTHHSIGILFNPQFGLSLPPQNTPPPSSPAPVERKFRIDEFSKPDGFMNAADRTRYSCIGFSVFTPFVPEDDDQQTPPPPVPLPTPVPLPDPNELPLPDEPSPYPPVEPLPEEYPPAPPPDPGPVITPPEQDPKDPTNPDNPIPQALRGGGDQGILNPPANLRSNALISGTVRSISIDEFSIPHGSFLPVDRTRYTCFGFSIPGSLTSGGGFPVTGGSGNIIFGIDTALYYGFSGVLSLADAGPYSGNPLSMVPYRPTGSGAAWLYIGDSRRMRKIRSDGIILPIGLPPIHSLPSMTPHLEQAIELEPFNSTDGWGKFAYNGSAIPGDPTHDPNPNTGRGLKFTTDPGGATGAYANAWDTGIDGGNMENGGAPEPQEPPDNPEDHDLPRPEERPPGDGGNGGETPPDPVPPPDPNPGPPGPHDDPPPQALRGLRRAKPQVIPGSAQTLIPGSVNNVVQFSDSDYIQFWMKLSRPDITYDVRLDFGCGGTGDNFFTKHFRPSDFSKVSISGDSTQDAISGEDQAARNQQLDAALNFITDNRQITAFSRAQRNPSNIIALQTVVGDASWTQFGTFGVSLRRGDFLRRGNDLSVGWSSVQSITVTVFVSEPTEVEVSLSDLRITGGSGPDSGEFGTSGYDYRVINYDTRTGAKSNPSPVIGQELNVLRRSIDIVPPEYGDPFVRQWFYRRGGTLNNNWYFVGSNATDGGEFVDSASDAFAAQGVTLELDNDQPVSTSDENGNTVVGQALPSLFGPLQDFLFGCGDPFRPGHVYYCKQGHPDSWPPQNVVEVCAPSEILQAGGVYGTQAFVFSRDRLYFLLVNAGTLGLVTAIPTQCLHGMYNRWGLVVGKDGIYFVSYDGVYKTQGGAEEYISGDIQPLFQNEVSNGYFPIDLTVVEALRLEIHDNDLWLLYQDTNGDRQVMLYSLLNKYWRHYNFGRSLAIVKHDGSVPRLLMGGFGTGATYVHETYSDDGDEIHSLIQTPYMDQGLPRQNKSYGDIVIDLSRGAVDITIDTSLDFGVTTLAPVEVTDNTQADL